ncbi:MAG: glutamine--tRNA ligase/YqeY domain fusion protein [Chloroflexota bacterium]
MTNTTEISTKNRDFIREIIDQDNARGAYDGRVVTRFPPEPNGFLHIGHAKSITLNFGLAQEYGGRCHMRFDDTNPTTEDMAYVESILDDIHWLGFDWGKNLFYASDYFEQLYDFAVQLIQDGKAYVDSLSEEEIRAYRGTVKEAGKDSPHRNRSVEENLDLFARMRAGEFADGEHVLRAKIDMAAANMKMRDPLLYRIRHAHHYRTGDEWHIYPMYDFAHPLSDAIENVTHSICTLEFENNRAIYDWLLDNTGLRSQQIAEIGVSDVQRPYQYEFARLNLNYTVMSKRKLLQLVEQGHVSGWDDPRMLTISGLRRRGVRASAIRTFAERVGVAKNNSIVDMSLLEHCIRDDLNQVAPRVMCVLKPLKVVITNYPEGQEETLDAPYYPHDVPKEGSRAVPFSREIYIDRDDFRENPSRKFFRLSPGNEVRLRYAYIIKCDEVIKDDNGEIVELRCSYDTDVERRVKGTIHWVAAAHAIATEVRLYDRLFSVENPDRTDEGKTFLDYLNPNALQTVKDALIEPSVVTEAGRDISEGWYQFERTGYFYADPIDSMPAKPVFNRVVSLRDSWAKQDPRKAKQTNKNKAKGNREAERAQKQAEKQGSKQSSGDESNRRSKSDIRAELRANSPELTQRYERYVAEFGLTQDEADVLTGDLAVAQFFDETVNTGVSAKSAANWVANELLREVKEQPVSDLKFDPTAFGQLVALVDDNTISGNIGKTVLGEMVKHGGDPAKIVEKKGLQQITDTDTLAPMIAQILSDNEDKVAAYRSGKTGLMGFFVGQAMRASKGKADPQLVQQLLRESLV